MIEIKTSEWSSIWLLLLDRRNNNTSNSRFSDLIVIVTDSCFDVVRLLQFFTYLGSPPVSISVCLTPINSEISGMAPMLGKRSVPFSGIDVFHEEANVGEEEDNLSDEGSQLGEKKRRLNMLQVKTLEKNFELGNKLEPERKSQLAKALGLQPRQIAIWFQNRRARWKAKQLEKDYVILKRQFDSLKADNHSLLAQNHKLQSEILTCKGREPTESINLNKETDQGSCSNKSKNSSDIKLDISTRTAITGSRAFLRPPANGPAARLFQNPPPAHPDLHSQKFDHNVREEGLTNMFCGIDDQSGFWPWIEQPNFS